MGEKSIAKELLQDMKKINKRMFIALLLVIALWFATIGMFVYYITHYTFEETVETYTTEMDTEDNGYINIGGDVNNGTN